MNDIRIKMAKDLRDMSDMVGDLHWMAAKAVDDLIKKDGEIAKRDARIVELEARIVWLECESQASAAPVSEAKAQGVYSTDPLACTGCASGCFRCLNAAPVQQAVPDVSAMARILADRSADACNVNRGDNWAIHGQDYIDDVTAMLAAPAAPAADACKACKGTGRRPIGGRGRIFGLTNRCFECQPLTDEEVYGQVTAHE